MSFKEDHPNYKTYRSDYLHYSDLPYDFGWSTFESLVDEAGGPDRELLPKVVQKIATKARAGSVNSGAPYMWIDHLVSKIREQVSNGKFYVLMDCLAILCDDGELSTETLNEFLEDYHIGYRAYSDGWNRGILWEKIESEANIVEGNSSDDTVLLLPDTKFTTSKEEMDIAKKEVKMKSKDNRMEIFISHRSVDADIADMIKDFLVSTGIPNDKIFCSSLPGNDVNERISPEVKEHLKAATVIVLILSEDFYKSAYCINEAGVAWYLDDIMSIPVALPEIQPADMVGFLNSDYKIRRLDNDNDISYLYDQVQERLDVNPVKHGVVTRETIKLKEKYHKYIENKKKVEPEEEEEDDEYDFRDEDEQLIFNNQVMDVIGSMGGEIDSLKALSDSLGLSEKTMMRKLKGAIDDGVIEVISTGRKKKYRIKNKPYSPVVGQYDVGNIPADSALLLVYAASDNGQIIMIRTWGSPTQVLAAGKQFMADNSNRESARWVEALDRLISWGWVKATGSRGEIFELTGTGYQKADYLKEGMGINTDNEPSEELKAFEG